MLKTRGLVGCCLVAVFPFILSVDEAAGQVVPEGTPIEVRLAERVSSEEDHTGDRFQAILDRDLVRDGRIIAPAGSQVRGELLEVVGSGKVKGRARMEMTLREIEVRGGRYPLQTHSIRIEARGTKAKDAKVVGGGAGIGALLGGIIGGKKGAALGAAIGAGAGGAVVLTTDGEAVEFEPEQRFQFSLREDLRLPVSGARESVNQGPSDDSRLERPSRTTEEIRRAGRRLRDASARSRRTGEGSARRILGSAGGAGNGRAEEGVHLYFLLEALAESANLFSDLAEQYPSERLKGGLLHLRDLVQTIDEVLEGMPASRTFWEDWEETREASQALEAHFLDWEEGRSAGAGPGRLRWEGSVDEKDQILLRQGEVSTRHFEGRSIRNASFDLSGPLPRRPVHLTLRKMDGRGSIRIVEEPSRWNDYTAIVLVEDPRGGADRYVFELAWE